MNRYNTSIFNDVLGPIMVGASSSHLAAAARIGYMAASCLSRDTAEVRVEFGKNSSLAYTYHSHGSDMGFAAGLLGLPLDDEKVQDSVTLARQTVPLRFIVTDKDAEHPNNYLIKLIEQDGGELRIQAVSTGGGMIELREFAGVPIKMYGDRHEALLLCSPDAAQEVAARANTILNCRCTVHTHNELAIVELTFASKPNPKSLARCGAEKYYVFEPVVPILSHDQYNLPFESYSELEKLLDDKLPLSEFALDYESARGRISKNDVILQADKILSVMEKACAAGQDSVEYENRILTSQAYKLNHIALPPHMELVIDMVRNITAVMESKSAMKPIVAAPTAGSCGCIPGSLCTLAAHLHLERPKLIRALLSAGLIGLFFCNQATFAAELGGCQMECGAASGMTAAAITELYGGTAKQSLAAAAIALQGITGLACDPVAGRVEHPCLNKNIMAGMNALSSATMALADFDQVIPLNQTIDAIYEIGRSLPQSLRCTHGGLGCTAASMQIKARLDEKFPLEDENSRELHKPSS